MSKICTRSVVMSIWPISIRITLCHESVFLLCVWWARMTICLTISMTMGFILFIRETKDLFYVSNYPHGMASQKHVQSYRAWSAYSLWGRPVTNLTALANIENGGLQVKAIVYSGSSSSKFHTRCEPLLLCAQRETVQRCGG